MTTPTLPAFLTPAEVAPELRVHRKTVMAYIRDGRIPGVILGGGKRTIYRVPRAEWEAYCAGRWRGRGETEPSAPVALLHRRAS